MDTSYIIRSKKTESSGEMEIRVEISAEALQAHQVRILAHMRTEFDLPGFRKGNVPEDIFMRHVNAGALLEEAAHSAVNEIVPLLFHAENLHPMVAPEVTVTKMALGNNIECTIRIAPFPEINLPDYKKIARTVLEKNSEKIVVSDHEVEQIVTQILTMRSAAEPGKDAAPKKPELTDELVKSLGRFENIADFKEKIRENIKLEKELDAQAARREKIAQALIEKTKIKIPEIVITQELEAIDARMNSELARVGASREDHLKKIQKTEEELAREQREHIDRQLKTRLIYDAIAKKEGIVISDEEVLTVSSQIHGRNPGMKPLELQNYAAIMLMNEKVLALLEGNPTKDETPAGAA